MRDITSLILILFCGLNTGIFAPLLAQTDTTDYYQANFLRYENKVYTPTIKTVQLYKAGWENSWPIIQLGSGEQLELNFDDFNLNAVNYNYTVVHCDANWEPSQLNVLEYITGMPDVPISDFTFSQNTRQRFVHYRATFPNDQFRLTRSGNYLIKVIDMNTNEVVITWRFYVVDPLVDVRLDVKQATQGRYRFTHHEVDFTIRQGNYQLTNPYTDMYVVVMQNQRWDNAITNLKPLFVRGDELQYNYEDRNLFPGGNEFRQFDTRDLRYTALRTERIGIENDTVQVWIEADEVRSIKVYLDQPDINGKFLINSADPREDSDIDGDYVMVHFRMPYPYPLTDGNLYLFGQMTEWRYDTPYLMKYNEERRWYEASVLLKQGFYNYLYLLVKDGTNQGDVSFIEGSHAQTQNEYTVLVYHRRIGDIYDQLINISTVEFPVR